jgi:hypothetical protein
VLAGRAVGVQGPVAVAGALTLTALVALAPSYVRRPSPGSGKRFELLSGVWTLAMYLSVGILPLGLRWWSAR